MTSTLVNSRLRDISKSDVSLLAQGPYRGLPATADTFARESHIDELAYVAGADPVDFRLGLLDDARLAAVIEAAARRFGWRFFPCPAGRPALWAKGWLWCGAGIAAGLDPGRRVATCAEVHPDGSGQLRVTRVVTAYECGAVADRAAVISQVHAGTVLALGGTLLGPSACPPEVDVVLLDRPDLPSAGVGETPLITLAPAIANAIFAVTGRRCVR
jgi:CO/xanthine dehydrogenase Mo-binding subunit